MEAQTLATNSVKQGEISPVKRFYLGRIGHALRAHPCRRGRWLRPFWGAARPAVGRSGLRRFYHADPYGAIVQGWAAALKAAGASAPGAT